MRIVQALFILFGIAGALPISGEEVSPNVLVLMASDLGMGDLSLNGGNLAPTPRIDALASAGLRFEKFYATPVASTTSASLLTGRYHYRTGVFGESGPEAMMHESEHTLGELFRENGYRTAWFGRWLHGLNWPQNAAGQGFDHHSESCAVDEVKTFLAGGRTPFFCVAYFPRPRLENAAHLAPQEQQNQVAKQLALLDQETGQLLDHLEAVGQKDHTVVIWLSDNGPDHFGATRGRYNAYYYGGRGSVHEGGIRVPCLVAWPGKIKPASRFTRIAAAIDWYPTLRSLCALRPGSREFTLDGSDLSSVLLNGGESQDWPNRILFTSWTPPGRDLRIASVAVRSDRWVALRDPRWRRDETIVKSRNGWELYDLNADPFQNEDQGDRYVYLLSDLRADLTYWLDHATEEGLPLAATLVGQPKTPEALFEANPAQVWPVRVAREGDYEVKIKKEDATGEMKGSWQVGGRNFPWGPGTSLISLKSADTEIRWRPENGIQMGAFSLSLKK